MKYVGLLVVFVLLLSGCKSNDEFTKSDEEMVEEGAYALVVRVDSVFDTIQGYYFDGSVPKTVFTAECIFAIVGECSNPLLISRRGGIDENGKYVGVYDE